MKKITKGKAIEKTLLFIKGMFIGSGFILPGVSGGAMAAVFGLYERLISFIADLRKDFKKNMLFFLPVFLGAAFGMFLLSFLITYLFEAHEAAVRWFFIGCILGTLPSLNRQAKKKGRKSYHLWMTLIAAVISSAVLFFLNHQSKPAESVQSATFPIWSWVLAGALIGLGIIMPGLSPSNFLILFGMYSPMSYAIQTLNFGVLLPLALGAAACVIALSKIMRYLLDKAYAGIFHITLGIVFSSTMLLIPLNVNYLSTYTFVMFIFCLAGGALGLWMSKLEDKYVSQ